MRADKQTRFYRYDNMMCEECGWKFKHPYKIIHYPSGIKESTCNNCGHTRTVMDKSITKFECFNNYVKPLRIKPLTNKK